MEGDLGAGGDFAVKPLKCAHIITESTSAEARRKEDFNSCYMCCGNARNCRYGAAKWSSFFAKVEAYCRSRTLCLTHRINPNPKPKFLPSPNPNP